ncbi:hypothetical protein COT54_03400 [Candidatus Collierbacteria bacterium CG09_land_8_20_14_0_10_46_12]|uniref:Mur ligase C-terminal domain-containing protein n=1 Tax=Candidatus Collierbacteria bacterium CG09_land_8_20_14_0_10_46_12 TaxID=1974533 RepID=A0A2H0WYD5_9BACT|nr:MAG: hypothetical protein COT54_03400 [Candidatus Collierbacteria bacterium CG09_land_8_20_14_0_10_46_12]
MKKILARIILDYFRFFARLKLRQHKSATIIAVTGSLGKTTTRLALVQILKSRGIVKHSVHANSASGISLNILGLYPHNYSIFDWLRLIILTPISYFNRDSHYDYYVVEMGIDSPDSPNNMAYLLSIIRPHVGVVLNASLVHSLNFDRLVKDQSPVRRLSKLVAFIAEEKLNLARGVRSGGVAVFNLDQKQFALSRKTIKARQLTFGKSASADLRILPEHRLSYQGQKYEFNLSTHLTGAIAGACALGIPPSVSLQALKDFSPPAGRLQILKGIAHSTILDSSYNASPEAMFDSLKQLHKVAGSHKKIAVLGDMRELGISEKIAHKNLADWLIKYSDETILFGPLTAQYTAPVLESCHFPVRHFKTMLELIKYLRESLPAKSYVLVKGSQNELYLERAVESILSDPQDISKLCRRGPYWDKIRASMI